MFYMPYISLYFNGKKYMNPAYCMRKFNRILFALLKSVQILFGNIRGGII